MTDPEELERFESVVMPHFPAAYNFARWLTRREADAEDVVQEAFVRAFKSFDRYRGGDARAWIFTIVRNTCYTWLRQNRSKEMETAVDLDAYEAPGASNPERAMLQSASQDLLRGALEKVPLEFREILILRELDGLSYKEIGEVTGQPMGTIMSRLSRGRDRLQRIFSRGEGRGAAHEL